MTKGHRLELIFERYLWTVIIPGQIEVSEGRHDTGKVDRKMMKMILSYAQILQGQQLFLYCLQVQVIQLKNMKKTSRLHFMKFTLKAG